ncbi:MAG: PrsW family intramembrane metalloprotease [Ignavibacteriaceae bacterium]
MIYLISAAAAIIPMIIYLIIIWRFDRYDREPFGLVIQNYLWGAAGAILLTFIFGSILNLVFSSVIADANDLDNFETIILAPIVEESMKGLFLLITITNRKFDNITDGLVYGGAIGLGFGMTENFLYFITYAVSISDWIFLVIVRTLFSGVMHCVATAIFGAFLGYAKFKEGTQKFIFALSGLLLAVTLHFTWNLSVSFDSTIFSGFASMILIFAVFIIVFSFSVLNEKKLIYNELIEEVKTGIIPVEHLNILNSKQRNRNGWIDEEKRKSYVNAAITLAFRKVQHRNSSGADKYLYEQDIEHYRLYIRDLNNSVIK